MSHLLPNFRLTWIYLSLKTLFFQKASWRPFFFSAAPNDLEIEKPLKKPKNGRELPRKLKRCESVNLMPDFKVANYLGLFLPDSVVPWSPGRPVKRTKTFCYVCLGSSKASP